ncbi:MAG TPA: Rieske 2Fe-2S domain-containing protein [Actinomycetota bacterium]|jgi:ubiquinol-cytochrome c reductase iron-sulfur subunit|nr:Rieske 2Fe-2S domain-containing protein [Actinomycetota bacterium]
MKNVSRSISIALVVSMLASIGLVGVYIAGGDRTAEGILLGLALGGLGAGIVLWTRLIDTGPETEEREPLESLPEERLDPVDLRPEGLTRRSLLVRLVIGAGGALAAALAIPTLSLGPRPGASLFRTQWRAGIRVVDEDGAPIRPSDLPLEGVRTVFPEDAVGSADSQTQLIRVEEGLLDLDSDRREWAVEGVVGYSKICTHAGCPVGLYRAEAHELLCPCHQSTFDILRGAVPVFGPAARPLPQLPLGIDEEGYLIARGDFPEPVGPSFWNVHSRDVS